MQNIVKILSPQEVEDHVLPVLDIYSSEQEFLKLQFLQSIPQLVSKLLASQELPRKRALELATQQVFPVI